MLAATDLCLHILREDHGQTYANDVARLLVSPPYGSGGQAQYRTARASVGLGTVASFRRHFVRHAGVNPRAYRRTFASRTTPR